MHQEKFTMRMGSAYVRFYDQGWAWSKRVSVFIYFPSALYDHAPFLQAAEIMSYYEPWSYNAEGK